MLVLFPSLSREKESWSEPLSRRSINRQRLHFQHLRPPSSSSLLSREKESWSEPLSRRSINGRHLHLSASSSSFIFIFIFIAESLRWAATIVNYGIYRCAKFLEE